MTLVCSVGKGGFLALGDVLVSSVGGGDPRDLQMPMHDGAVQHVGPGGSFAGLTQKVVLVGNTLFLWAGSLVTAKAIIAAAVEASGGGLHRIDFIGLVDQLGLNVQEFANTSVIYHHIEGDALSRQWHQGYESPRSELGLVHAGSGSFDFLDNTAVEDVNAHENSGVAFIGPWVSKVFTTLVSEAVSRYNFDFHYGGWFELASVENGEFRKWPLAIKFWSVDGDRLIADLPAFVSWYDESDLFIARLSFRHDPDPVPDFFVHAITDFLGRPSKGMPAGPASIPWEPKIQCHVLVSGEKLRFMIKNGDYDGFRLNFRDDEVEFEFSEEFIQSIYQMAEGVAVHHSVSKPYA